MTTYAFVFSAAGLGLLLYDHFITFSDEVDLVWMAPHSFSKWAFLLNKYVVVAAHITNSLRTYMRLFLLFFFQTLSPPPEMGFNVELSQRVSPHLSSKTWVEDSE
jgi:hypothetical protein